MKQAVGFRNIGKNQQHEVTLIGVTEHGYDLASSVNTQNIIAGYAEETIYDCWAEAKKILETKGFEDTTGFFCVIEGKIVKCDYLCLTLWEAIQQRDKGKKTGEYLAAIIDHKCKLFETAKREYQWHGTPKSVIAMLNTAMEIQNFHFQLFLLEQVHPQYSAGTKRMHKDKNIKSEVQIEAEKKYREYRLENRTKENCYKLTATWLAKKFPTEKTPKAGTIKKAILRDEHLKSL